MSRSRHWVWWLFTACLCVFGCGEGTRDSLPGGRSRRMAEVSPRLPDRSPLIPAEDLIETVILPHPEGPISAGTNYVYCATFQLAWNELRDKVIGAPIELEGGPPWTSLLNKSTFGRSDLSEDCYLAMGGRGEEGIVERDAASDAAEVSRRPIRARVVGCAGYYAFAYLVKTLSFQLAFERLDGELKMPFRGAPTQVAAFGFHWFGISGPRCTGPAGDNSRLSQRRRFHSVA